MLLPTFMVGICFNIDFDLSDFYQQMITTAYTQAYINFPGSGTMAYNKSKAIHLAYDVKVDYMRN